MKKFNFRLQTLLKFREFREKKLKEELGEINKNIQALRGRIKNLSGDIDLTYELQEAMGQGIEKGGIYQFIPHHVTAKRGHIEQTKREIAELEKQFEAKVEELKTARGETKVVEKLKEKDLEEYKKEAVRKEREFVEEMYNLKILSKNGDIP